MNIIETRNLGRSYGHSEALHGLNLIVPEGCIFAFIGPNGAGKTTTIKVLMNLLEPTTGEALVLGVNSRKLKPRERQQIGYVSENQKLPDWMTVRQLMNYCRPFYPTWDKGLEQKLLRQFELPPDRKIKHLSRGMMMKAALLSSLAYRPKLLVLDEPFSGLDPLVRDEFVHGVLEVAQQDEWTVFISSHDINEVEQLADMVGIIDGGKMSFAEPTEALQGRFRRVEVILGDGEFERESAPSNWLEVERTGNLVRFVDDRFSDGSFERYRQEYFPHGEATANPMTLREIFVVLTRVQRTRNRHPVA
jgi:ABC-2 type transport system ATP-binding protein